MTKKEFNEMIKEVKDYTKYICDYVKNLTAKEMRESYGNDSDLTQMLMDLGCMVNQIAETNGMGEY